MTVISFPKRPVPAHLADLVGYDRAAAQRGIRTMAIETIEAEDRVKARLQGILDLEELQVFGRYSNPLSMHFAFKTGLSVDEVREQTVAIRHALAEIGVTGMVVETKETSSHD